MILPTREAEIRKITVWGQTGEKAHEILSQSTTKSLGKVAHACHPSYVGSINRRITDRPGQSGHKCKTLLEKYLKQKGLGV
jgi:ribosomal protein L31